MKAHGTHNGTHYRTRAIRPGARAGLALALILSTGFWTSCGPAGEAPDAGEEQAAATETAPDRAAAPAPAAPAGDRSAGGASGLLVPAGTSFTAALEQELSTRTSTPGQSFSARVIEPVLVGDRIAIPSDAVVHGEVTAVQPATEDRPGFIKLDVRTIQYGGATHGLSAEVTEVAPQVHKETDTGEAVAKIGVSTAAGAILGRVIGGSTASTVIGAAAGAAAGTAIVLATQEEYAVLPARSPIGLRLREGFRAH